MVMWRRRRSVSFGGLDGADTVGPPEIPVLKPDADGPFTPKLTVESSENHIYFYSDVDSDRCLALTKSIRSLDSGLRNERLTRSIPDDVGPTPIWLHVNSMGGSLFDGLAVADMISKVPTPVYTIVEGAACSAASLIAMSGHRRFISKNAVMLIHQFTSIMWGSYEQFKDDMKLQDMMISQLREFYVNRSKLDMATVTEMLKHDSWFSSAECLTNGFVDEII
jgi:ATP-dependent Clp protease protease subunit